MKAITISDKEKGQRLDKFLVRYLPLAGKSFLYKMLRKKNIVLNGKKATGNELLVSGDEVKIFFSDETIDKFMGEEAVMESYPKLDPSRIVYEDENVIMLNKPVGLLSQKAQKDDISMNEYLMGYFLKQGLDTKSFSPGVANRLDRNTSGLILAGKNLQAQQELSQLLKERTMKKFYLALVEGELSSKLSVKGFLVKDEKSNQVKIYDHEVEHAQAIETAYEPLLIKKVAGCTCTLLLVELITGRTHQIRAHLSHLGHPIVGDAKYGTKDRECATQLRSAYGVKSQLLHAWKVCFPALTGRLETLSGLETIAMPDNPYRKILKDMGFREVL